MRPFTVTLLAMAASAVTARGIVYDCETTPQICLNTCWAIKCAGLPASLHGGGNKDRRASKKKGEENRNAWGYGRKPCNENHSWYWKNGNKINSSPDEYPYASAKEGGLKGTGKSVQLRCVPTSEQKSQSGKVSGLGIANDKDEWTTKWENHEKLPQDWCGPNPTCENDGHQFVATAKGVFILAPNPPKNKIPRFENAVYEGNSTAITIRADEADLDVDDVPDVVDEVHGEGVEARDAKIGVGFWG
ncbi:deoxyribonuclease nucA/NucB domain-containing protein [Apiospora marii]|uniref:Deoxyribonuclease nucA/NucB domain-containing protein n=1 Tax=Apiospora marii TaxID=335849 RepID=A0ABR1S9L1_9PEZI